MPTCIICHLEIEEIPDALYKCSNEHTVHKSCLAEWLLHSQNCPLCAEPYTRDVLNQFKDHLDQKEKEDLRNMEELTKNIVF